MNTLLGNVPLGIQIPNEETLLEIEEWVNRNVQGWIDAGVPESWIASNVRLECLDVYQEPGNYNIHFRIGFVGFRVVNKVDE